MWNVRGSPLLADRDQVSIAAVQHQRSLVGDIVEAARGMAGVDGEADVIGVARRDAAVGNLDLGLTAAFAGNQKK